MSTTIVAADQPRRPQLTAVGDSISFQAGAVRIVLHRWHAHYSVSCFVTARRLPAWCATYTSEDDARAEARRVARIFARHVNPERLDSYVVNTLRPAMVDAVAAGRVDRLAVLRAELAGLAPLSCDTRAA